MTQVRTFKDWLRQEYVATAEHSTESTQFNELKSQYEKQVGKSEKAPNLDYLKEIKDSGFKYHQVSESDIKVFVKRKPTPVANAA